MLPSALQLKQDAWWALRTPLASWVDFQTPNAAAGSVEVRFAPEGRGPEPLSPTEFALLQWFFDHEKEVADAVQHEILAAYPEIQAMFGGEGDDGQSELPDIDSIDELKGRLSLCSVNVHQVSHGGNPCLGFDKTQSAKPGTASASEA